jgi:capsular polysaccharide transport system permease protein
MERRPMIADPPRINEIELQPVHSKGELVLDNWWQPEKTQEPEPLYRRYALEIVTLALPVAVASVYLLLIASPRYVSESEFMVRTVASSDMGNLATLLSDQKVTRASDETYAVSEYLTSRDAVDTLAGSDGLKDILSRPQGDFINRFPNFFTRDTREQLYRHFQNFVDLKINTDSGIAELKTIAFTPDDAKALNKAMLRNAEDFVNRLNLRIFNDSLGMASQHVEEQKARFTEIEARLTNYRNSESVLDPNKEVADALTRIGALMTRLSKAESDLAQTTTLAPRAPQIAGLNSEVGALRDQIAAERQKLAGRQNSLSTKFAAFDRIMLDRMLASKQLESALAEYDKARQDLARQHFYLQTVVDPEAPDQAGQPRRLLGLFATAAISLAGYSILRAILKNVREHLL